MGPIFTEIRKKAPGLTPDERQTLVDDLVESLESEPLTEVEEAWMSEVRKRDADVKEGKVELLSHDQLIDF